MPRTTKAQREVAERLRAGVIRLRQSVVRRASGRAASDHLVGAGVVSDIAGRGYLLRENVATGTSLRSGGSGSVLIGSVSGIPAITAANGWRGMLKPISRPAMISS